MIGMSSRPRSARRYRDTKVIFFRRALRFLDEYTGDIFGLGSEALVKGQSVILTNQWLESFAEAAAGTDPATSAAAVKATLAALEAEDAIRDRKTCYEALLLNQRIVPDFKDKMMTKKFMKGVLNHHYWLPKADEIHYTAVCAFPPTKEVLADILYKELIKL